MEEIRKSDPDAYDAIMRQQRKRERKRVSDETGGYQMYARRGFHGILDKKTKFVVGEGKRPEKVSRVKFGLPNIDDLLEGL